MSDEAKPEPEVKLPSAGRTPPYHEVAAWVGYSVDDISGDGVAKVEGVFVDQESAEPAWVIAKLGRFGKSVPIPVRECAAAVGRVWVPHERDVIKDAPAIDPELPLNKEQELQVLEHYSIPPEVGRGLEIADRPTGTVTSQLPADAEDEAEPAPQA